MKQEIAIAGRRIGPAHRPYVIAELSGNHNGKIENALRLLEVAHSAGADAVKLQTYTADTLTIDHDAPDFRIQGGPWNNRTLYDLYQEAHTPWDWTGALFQRARELGITIFSSPFDETAIDLLETLDAPAYKIASFEIVDVALIARAARTGKPLIISTGLASTQEVENAVVTARDSGCRELLLLHCISGYPTPIAESNLRAIATLADRFCVPIGLSDHTLGIVASIAAVALGAVAIEKHITLSRAAGGVDAGFSLEPAELKDLVTGVNDAWSALGQATYGRAPSEVPNLIFRRSIYVVRDVAAGEEFTAQNLRVIRPGYGMEPRALPALIGKHAARALRRGTALTPDAVRDWSPEGVVR